MRLTPLTNHIILHWAEIQNYTVTREVCSICLDHLIPFMWVFKIIIIIRNHKNSFIYAFIWLYVNMYLLYVSVCYLYTHTHTCTWGLCVCLSDVVRLVCIYSKACRDAMLVVVSFFLLGMGGKSVARIYIYVGRNDRVMIHKVHTSMCRTSAR